MHEPSFLLFLSFCCCALLLSQSLAQETGSPSEAPPLCNEQDRLSLLSFKSQIVKDTTDILPFWVGKDCCSGGWEGVECDPATGRVTSLQLQRRPDQDAVYMEGTLSPSLGNLRSLQILVISGMKRIKGSIPESFSALTSLTQLSLENNALSGSIPSTLLPHMPSLMILSLSGNHLRGPIPPNLGDSKTLVQINLAMNSLAGPIPPTFKNLASLQYLDLSYNSLSGPIPDALGLLPKLTYMDLSSNSLSGQIPGSLCTCQGLGYLSLSRNQLTGAIPERIGNLRNLTTLSLSFNRLAGYIPQSISGLSSLWNLSLSANRLSGPLPDSMGKGNPSLTCVDLSHNNISLGTVPDWMVRRRLTQVRLAGCGLSGTLPQFAQPDSLTSVDLSDNHFTSGIQHFFTNMSGLQDINLSNNQLKGDLSTARLPEQLSSLNLHSNQLSGPLSTLLTSNNTKFLEVFDLSRNLISGRMPGFPDGLPLKVLSIGSNKVTGPIPESISKLAQLKTLDISRNQVTGNIPKSLGLLVGLQWLDVSINALTGGIPESLLGIKDLKHANFRANQLCGLIPQGRPYNIFPGAAYAHNPCLCGKPLPPCTRKNKEHMSR